MIVRYGPGGFDPGKPNGNIVESIDEPGTEPTPADAAQAVIEAVRDPDQKTPSIQKRLAALEALAFPPDQTNGGAA